MRAPHDSRREDPVPGVRERVDLEQRHALDYTLEAHRHALRVGAPAKVGLENGAAGHAESGQHLATDAADLVYHLRTR